MSEGPKRQQGIGPEFFSSLRNPGLPQSRTDAKIDRNIQRQ